MLRKWRMVPRHNISTILVESVFGGILWGKEFSHVPTTVVGTVPGGPFLMSRMAPRTPQEPPKGGRFDSPSLWNPSPTDQGRGTAVPLPWTLPGSSYFGLLARPPHFVAAAGHDEPLGRYKVRPRGLLVSGEQLRGVSKEGPPQWPFFGRLRGSPRGEIEIPPRGFFGGVGAFFAAKNAPKRPSLPRQGNRNSANC